MINKKSIAIHLSLLALLFVSCNRKQVPQVVVHFNRYDKAVFSQGINELMQNEPIFTPFYLNEIVQTGASTDSLTAEYLKKFTNTYRNNVYDSVQNAFLEMTSIEQDLGAALGNYKTFFPTDTLPLFYSHFSGFNESVVSVHNIISVSLENYLGKSHFYDELGIYKYLRKRMYPEKIAPDILKMLLLKKVAQDKSTDNLLASIIYQGRIFFILHKMFPEKQLSFLLNYTTEQEKWCSQNEAKMWSFLIEQKHLFSSNYRIIRSYIDPAPFTKYFPKESPGQAGIWLGYQIVKDYVANSKTSLLDLTKETDYKKILEQAAYNPE